MESIKTSINKVYVLPSARKDYEKILTLNIDNNTLPYEVWIKVLYTCAEWIRRLSYSLYYLTIRENLIQGHYEEDLFYELGKFQYSIYNSATEAKKVVYVYGFEFSPFIFNSVPLRID